ncbi:MAG: (d)CMP kinase [Deltaproteobacteria bacterium]|nr:(d)CMP kinase [Deltaproteobacteria bacterium]
MGPRGIITIDGPAGAGKSTVARLLAATLGYLYLDSGALDRLVGWQAAERNLDLGDTAALSAFLEGLQPEVAADAQGFHLFLDGQEVSQVLREPSVSREASRVAVLPPVRDWVTARLRHLAANGGMVADGRDLGTVVFPQAEVTFYLDASLEISAANLDASLETRAARRRQDWQNADAPPSPEKVAMELADRDRRDATRAAAPMRVPADALVIDTTNLNPQEVVRQCLERIREIFPETAGLEMKTG